MSPATIRTAVLLALSILAAPSVPHAQQSGKIWRIGIIAALSPVPFMRSVVYAPLIIGLRDLGYEEGRNVVFELRSAEGHLERLPDIAAELVALKVDVLVPSVCGPPLDAARQATSTIPIVVPACDDDMVESGIVASVAHPGGNVTGLTKLAPELTAKRLDLLKEMVPAASNVAVLWDPKISAYMADWRELRSRASAKGVTLQPLEAHFPADLDGAFTSMASERVDAVLTFSDVLTYSEAKRIAELTTEHRLTEKRQKLGD